MENSTDNINYSQTMYLVVHDADQIHNVYAADSKEEILERLKNSEWWEDIILRLSPEELGESGIRPEEITLDHITDNLHHDGDSYVGYTLNSQKKQHNLCTRLI